MDCKHCELKFEDQAKFAAHCSEHAKIQQRLKRTGIRTYGARYTESEAEPMKAKQQKPSPPDPPQQHDDSEKPHALPVRPKVLPAQAAPTRNSTSTSEGVHTDTLSKRVRAIMTMFSPYQGDGIEHQQQRPHDIPCPDCDFKFRNQQELDAHFLSLYCRGSHIVLYCLCVDRSEPRGYYVEEIQVPFDHHLHGSLFQCRKCESAFPTLAEKEKHEFTHPLLPHICLHCAKVFGTEYELETHYEWHDDMEYRHMVDLLPLPSQSAGPEYEREAQDEEIEVITSDSSQFRDQFLKFPLPYPVDKKYRKTGRSSAYLAGVSCISREDVERNFSFRGGVFAGRPTRHNPIAQGTDEEERRAMIELDDLLRTMRTAPPVPVGEDDCFPEASSPRFRIPVAPEVTHNKQSHGLAAATNSDSSKSRPDTGSLKHPTLLVGHHTIEKGFQVQDLSGRLRWLSVEAWSRVVKVVFGSPGLEAELGELAEAAVEWETGGDMEKALVSWKRAAQLLADSSNVERVKNLLAMLQLARLSSDLRRFHNAVTYYCDALELSQKIYGKDHIGNFDIINKLAVLFDENGDHQQAARFYRRSLSGRLSILGPDHSDTLMSTQELGMANRQLGHTVAARRLVETAYLGYENLTPPEERNKFMTLNNLATIYGDLGLRKEAAALLLKRIPLMRQVLGLEDRLVAYAVFNMLQYHQGPAIPDDVLGVIQDLQKLESEEGIVASEKLAAFFVSQQRYKEALPLYRDVVQRRSRKQPPLITEEAQKLMNVTFSLARCLFRLHLYQDAEAAYGQLASLAAVDPANRDLQAMATASAAVVRRKKDAVNDERGRWRLDEPGPCAACGHPTTRLCPICQATRFCSTTCDRTHHSLAPSPAASLTAAAGICIPSVTPAQSVTAILRPDFAAPEVERWFQAEFAGDPHIPRKRAGPPRLRSSQALFLPADPRCCFATLRLKKDPASLVTYWFNPRCAANASARVRHSGASLGWKTAVEMSASYLYPSEDLAKMNYLLVAPGREALAAASRERAAVTGVGGSEDVDVPDAGMIEYLQSDEAGSQDGGPLQLAAVVMEWEV